MTKASYSGNHLIRGLDYDFSSLVLYNHKQTSLVPKAAQLRENGGRHKWCWETREKLHPDP